MPIFQDDLDHHEPVEPPPVDVAAHKLRRLSEESICTELCEGLVPDSPPRPSAAARTDDGDGAISDRAALIERLKRAQSPTWIPNRHLESILQNTPVPATNRPQTPTESSTLLPPAQITPEKNNSQAESDNRLHDGLSIERPRSALHSGNFTEEEAVPKAASAGRNLVDRHDAPAEASWIATSPPRHFTPFQHDKGVPFPESTESFRFCASPLSSSVSSSFIYKPPTSPLVQSHSYDELDISMPLGSFGFSSSSNGARRHTAHSLTSSPFLSPSPRQSLPPRVPSYRREAFPYQAHQPRRSLTSTPTFVQPGTSPPTPAFLRSRRSSIVSDSSPLHHASMVGSYEESILRGRMSTTPSKPLDFVAQIGVLGKGKCKPNLKCPPHVTLTFPAVYYSYSSTTHGRSGSEDGPSPYVGQIDLENGLPNLDDEHRAKKKAQSRYIDRMPVEEEMDVGIARKGVEQDSRRNSRTKRRAGSPKAPPGGSYRIPEKGQVQIIIKNPNKTAVKLFLIPYDLSGMEPGTKTFVRQRSYSAGPIIDNAPQTSDTSSEDRPILRYLAHLHICCPAKGRYYLYKSIRIVFANRVPDGKEKLRNETTWPEPRFTPYKPIRVMHPPLPTQSGPAAMLAMDKALRRRSAGFCSGPAYQAFDGTEGMFQGVGSSAGSFAAGNILPIDPVPFRLPGRDRVGSDVSDVTNITGAVTTGIHSPRSSQTSRPSTKDSTSVSPWGPTLYEKLNKGEPGYGGNAFASNRSGSPGGTEGLLSQRLRSLGMKPPPPPNVSDHEGMSP
ncbi:hypothetical protein FDECE_13717 [Fusarium decemcellulare]|nr:hypothetical protein FDECE_13717 [Fusarium decemcellulare]